jgi:protein-disulfide isomerase
MRKLVILGLLFLLSLGVLVAPAAAAPVSDLTGLAQYLPDNTVFFGALRTDDAYIESLDGTLARLGKLLPPGAMPPVTLRAALNLAFQQAPFKSDFKTAVRSWLGDTVAVGVTSLTPDNRARTVPFLFIASITNRKAAEDFAEKLLENSSSKFERSTEKGYSIFADPNGNGLLAVNDKVIILTLNPSMLPAENLTSTLADSADFKDTVALLPATDYDILAYIKTGTIYDQSIQASGLRGDMPFASLFKQMGKVVGSQAWGFTMLDGRALVADFAQKLGDVKALTDQGIVMNYPTKPVSPDFAQYIPADAPLVIQGTELGPTSLAAIQNIRVLGDILSAEIAKMPESNFNRPADRFLRHFRLGDAVTFTEFAFAGMTGLNLEKDVLQWMTGSYAMYLRVLPLDSQQLPVTLDIAAVVENTDAAAVNKIVGNIQDSFKQYRIPNTEETIGGGKALVLKNPFLPFFPPRLATELKDAPDFDLVLGANDKVLTFGTRRAAAFSLDPKGDTLAKAEPYLEAQQYALKDAVQLWYLNTRAFVPLLDRELGKLPADSYQRRGLNDVRTAAGLFSSGSLSLVTHQDKGNTVRLVLTLAKEALPPLANAQVSTSTDTPTVNAVPNPYAGIPQSRLPDGGFVLGSPEAPVTIVTFMDYACSHCQEYLPTINRFVTEYVRTGKARYEFRIFPTAGGQTTTFISQIQSCLEAQQKGAFWTSHDLLFQAAIDGKYNRETGAVIAKQLGLDYNKAQVCATAGTEKQNDVVLANTLNINGTPAVMVRYGDSDPKFITYNGQTYTAGGVPYEGLVAAVEAAPKE